MRDIDGIINNTINAVQIVTGIDDITKKSKEKKYSWARKLCYNLLLDQDITPKAIAMTFGYDIKNVYFHNKDIAGRLPHSQRLQKMKNACIRILEGKSYYKKEEEEDIPKIYEQVAGRSMYMTRIFSPKKYATAQVRMARYICYYLEKYVGGYSNRHIARTYGVREQNICRNIKYIKEKMEKDVCLKEKVENCILEIKNSFNV